MESANFLIALVHFEEKPEFDTHDSFVVLYRGLSPWVVLRYAGLPSWSRGLSPGSCVAMHGLVVVVCPHGVCCDTLVCPLGISPENLLL